MVDSRYYSTPAAAEVLAVDVEQILRWIHSGDLPAYDVSKQGSKRPTWRIAEADLARFLMGRRSPASQVQPTAPKAQKRPPVKQYV